MAKKINIGNIQGVGYVEDGATVNQYFYQNKDKSFERKKEERNIFDKPNKEVYIKRDIDRIIEKNISQKQASIFFVHGQGGIGKSTLLKNLSNQVAIPTILININDNDNILMLEVLLNKSITSVKNCPLFEKKLDEVISYKERNSNYDYRAEYDLLVALKEDFRDYGIFIIDTFEKNKNSNIKSKIIFKDDTIDSNRIITSYRFKDYLESLMSHFYKHTLFVIAGRNKLDRVNENNLDLYLLNIDNISELSLEIFNLQNIKDYFVEFANLYKIDMPNHGQLKRIEELTRGNPLLLHSFSHVAKQYKSWKDVNFEKMAKVVDEDEKYGLLYYFTETIASHTKYSTELWKLVIPRVLTKDIENILFSDVSIFDTLIDASLVFEDGEKYTLHDEVLMAIKAYAKKNLKENFLSWHDNPKVVEQHKKLADFYKQGKLKDDMISFNSCYHKMMIRKNFDFSIDSSFAMSKEDFIRYFLGSLFIGYDEKVKTCKNFLNLNEKEIKEKIIKIVDEMKSLLPHMSKELYNKCSTDIGEGKTKNGIYNIRYLNKLIESKKYKKELILYTILGKKYQQNKEYEKERKVYEQAVALDLDKHEDDSFYLLIGDTYSAQKEEDKALIFYNLAKNINPNRNEAYTKMSIIYHSRGNSKKARELCEKSLNIKPNEGSYINMGAIYYNENKYDIALNLFYEAIKINSKSDFAYNLIGNVYREKKQYSRAMDSYNKALKINPKNENTWNDMGITFYQNSEYEKAVIMYQKSIKLNSQNELFHNNIGNAYFILRDYDKSIECFKKAIDLNPKNSEFYRSVGRASRSRKISWYKMVINYKNIKMEQYIQSVGYYKKAILLNPEKLSYYMELADIYYDNNQYTKAIEKYKRVIEVNPKNKNACWRLANIYLDKKRDYTPALILYKRLVELEPNNIRFRLKVGDCYQNLKNCTHAIVEYKKVIKMDKAKFYREVYGNLANCYYDKKDYLESLKTIFIPLELEYKQFKIVFFNILFITFLFTLSYLFVSMIM